MYLFEGLKKKISKYLPADDVELVQKAYVVAREAHEGQTRRLFELAQHRLLASILR